MKNKSINILLIEDNAGDARLVKEMLADIDLKSYFGMPSFDLTRCDRLHPALSLLATKSFDIILVDLSLPDSQGIETVKSVCQIAPNVPIIVLSGESEASTTTLAVHEGVQDYLLKGHIDSQLLVRSIRYAIERKKKDILLTQLASFDSLTKLANRTLFTQKLTQALAMARRHQWIMAILFLDLDHFKLINDNMSHKVGDIVLQTVANRLTAILQASDTIARMGGDEFVIILPKIKDPFSAGKIAKRILDALKEPMAIDEKTLLVTGSIGISLYPDNADEEQLLLRYADIAMYEAKHAGGNEYKFHQLEMTKEYQQKIMLEHELKNGLVNKKFMLLYRPQIDLVTGIICGVECSLHLICNDKRILKEKEIIPILKELGLMASVGEWIVNTILVQTKLWKKNKFNLLVTISSLTLSDNSSVQTIKQLLKKNKLDRLEIGINQQVHIQEIEPIIKTLKSLGIHLALNHFFAGSASLNCLREFPIDTIRIDPSLIEYTSNKKEAAIIIGIINMAHSMGITVVGEGVETKSQMQFLRAHGCDKAQGSYVSMPVDAEKLLLLMKSGI